MSPAMTCQLCHKLLAGSVDGQTAHMRRYHNVSITRKYIPMDPEVKARIVQKVETRLGDHIIGTNGRPVFVASKAYEARAQARQLLTQATDESTRQELEKMIDDLTIIIRGQK